MQDTLLDVLAENFGSCCIDDIEQLHVYYLNNLSNLSTRVNILNLPCMESCLHSKYGEGEQLLDHDLVPGLGSILSNYSIQTLLSVNSRTLASNMNSPLFSSPCQHQTTTRQCLSWPHWLLYWMVRKQGVDNVIVHILFLAHLVHALPPVSHHHGSLVYILNPKIPRIRL